MILKMLNFFPPASRNVASSIPSGICSSIEKTMTVRLCPNDFQNISSWIRVFQLSRPIRVLSDEIPFHLNPLIINVSITGYTIKTIISTSAGRRNTVAALAVLLAFA